MSLAPRIHPTAVVSTEAAIADDVTVGAYAVIEGPVKVGPGCTIGAHVHLTGHVEIGENNTFGTGAVIGAEPQHLGYRGEATGIHIGDGNRFREYATVHRGMPVGSGPGTGVTRIGHRNLFMVESHVGHDCIVGNDGVYANGALLAGHVETGDRVLISGNSAVHQFCRIGRLALVSGVSATSKDVPPFWIIQGHNKVGGLNLIGMRRSGMPADQIQAVRRAFRLIYIERLNITAAVAQMESKLGTVPAVREVIDFIRSSKRGISGPTGYLPTSGEAAA